MLTAKQGPAPWGDDRAGDGLEAYRHETIARISTFPDCSFQFDEDGPIEALLFPVGVWGDKPIVDIIAWELGTDRPWWWLTGTVPLLGEELVWRAWWEEGRRDARPLRLVETPEAYIRDRGESACIIDWSADPRSLLGIAPEIVCETPALERQLRETLEAQRRPSFTIRCAA